MPNISIRLNIPFSPVLSRISGHIRTFFPQKETFLAEYLVKYSEKYLIFGNNECSYLGHFGNICFGRIFDQTIPTNISPKQNSF